MKKYKTPQEVTELNKDFVQSYHDIGMLQNQINIEEQKVYSVLNPEYKWIIKPKRKPTKLSIILDKIGEFIFGD